MLSAVRIWYRTAGSVRYMSYMGRRSPLANPCCCVPPAGCAPLPRSFCVRPSPAALPKTCALVSRAPTPPAHHSAAAAARPWLPQGLGQAVNGLGLWCSCAMSAGRTSLRHGPQRQRSSAACAAASKREDAAEGGSAVIAWMHHSNNSRCQRICFYSHDAGGPCIYICRKALGWLGGGEPGQESLA